MAERTDAGDARGYRIALIADELLNPAEGGIDGLAELERAGWGAVQLPAKTYPDLVARPMLEQVAANRGWYSPYWHYENGPKPRAALDLIFSDGFSPRDPGALEPLRGSLLASGDHYMHLADFSAYLDADRRLLEIYADPEAWSRKVIANIASSGRISSDRTISEYARDIWNLRPCPIP